MKSEHENYYTLIVKGSSFAAEDVIQWNGFDAQGTSFISSEELRAVLPLSMIRKGSASLQILTSEGVFSAPVEFVVSLFADDLSQVRVFPNPWSVNKHRGQSMTFDNLASNSRIMIHTLSGQKIRM